MMISEKKENCCGCTACANICPVNAITMEIDSEGFSYPKINKNICINCGACHKVCPFLEQPNKNEIIKKVFSCHTKERELLKRCSSGGIFGELADIILKRKGIIVGVNNEYKYTIINNKKDLEELYGSKYVQAEILDIFNKIKTELNNKKIILFCGTPCTINGLKNYLKKDYDTLYTCDFICHGVPSQKWLDSYKKSLNKKVTRIDFRAKTHGWHNFSTIIYYKNNKNESLAIDNEYMRAFLNDFCLRESCYNCKIKGKNRKADITLGDYWGIDSKDEIYNFYGNSIVVTNTKKGEELFEEVKTKLYYKEINAKELDKNPSYNGSSKRPIERNDFYKDLNNMKYKKLLNKYNLRPTIIRRLKIKLKNLMKG